MVLQDPQGPAALPYQKSLQMSGSSGCLEIDDEVFNGNPDLVILHTYRRTILDGFAPPVIETVYNNGKWNVCSVNGSNLPNDSNSHYDLLVVADLSN